MAQNFADFQELNNQKESSAKISKAPGPSERENVKRSKSKRSSLRPVVKSEKKRIKKSETKDDGKKTVFRMVDFVEHTMTTNGPLELYALHAACSPEW